MRNFWKFSLTFDNSKFEKSKVQPNKAINLKTKIKKQKTK